ncbi:MAG: LexA family protein [Arcobacter sp.]
MFPGTLLLVERTEYARVGDLVVASVNDNIVVRFLQDVKGQLHLCPANKTYQNIPVVDEKVNTLGIVRGYYTSLATHRSKNGSVNKMQT